MWILLLISFGMTICLLILMAIFGLNKSDGRDGKRGKVPETTPPVRQNTSQSTEVQEQPSDPLISTSE